LPTEPSEGKTLIERAWSGGASGREILDRFLQGIRGHIKIGGRVLLMQSTLADVDKTMKILEGKGFKGKTVASLDLPFFETIVLIEAKANFSQS